jgi:hypothetical protein
MITDSIGGEKYVRHDLLEKVTKTKITKAKAYGPVRRTRQEGYKFPDKNFSSVVPQVLASDNFDVAIMMAPSVILSNLPPHTPQEQAEEQAREGSQQMVKIATEAIKANSNLQQLIIMQAAPRYDQWKQTNEFANDQLKEALQDVDDESIKRKISIGHHNLDCQDGMRLSRYGDPARCRADGIHLRGSSGMMAMTRSIAAIMAGAGLTTPNEAYNVGRSKVSPQVTPSTDGFTTQNTRRRQASPQQNTQFNLPTQNRFSPLGN